MPKIALAVMAVIAIMSSIGSAVWPFTSTPESYSGPTESIVFGGLVSDANIMLFIAEDQHFFAAEWDNLDH